MYVSRVRPSLQHGSGGGCCSCKGFLKPVNEPGSYRSISLLDGAGKLLERLVLNRMMDRVTERLTSNQYGFCLGKGTTDAIEAVLRVVDDAARGVVRERQLGVLVTLDMRNAFNTAP